MKAWLKTRISVREIVNPLSDFVSCDLDLIVKNHKGRIELAKQGVGQQTEYLLTVSNPMALGISEIGANEAKDLIDDLLLACNLCLKQMCITRAESQLHPPQVNPVQEPIKIEHTPTGPRINITAAITSSVHFTIASKETLDEDRTIDCFTMLKKLNRHSTPPVATIPTANMSKTLLEFEAAMAATTRLIIFKNLYTSLQVSVNWDGTGRTGSELDAEVTRIGCVSESQAKPWRDLFNRTKHEDTDTQQVSQFVEGQEKLPGTLNALRESAASAIIDRLRRIEVLLSSVSSCVGLVVRTHTKN